MKDQAPVLEGRLDVLFANADPERQLCGRMKMSLTTRVIGSAVAIVFWMALTANASPVEEVNFLAKSFPEKIGPFTRVSVSKNEAAIQGDIIDAATAKYVSGASEIEWSGTQFAASEQAFAALEKMMSSYEKEGAGISSVKNVEGKVRYAVIEMPQGIVCVWVNKQRKDLFFVATGKLPEIETFMRLQTTW